MTSKLEALADYLAGGRGAAAEQVRRELRDPASEAGRVLTAARQRSRDLFAPHVLNGLGLPPEVPRQPPASPAGRWLVRLAPWLLAAAAALLSGVLWFHRPGDGGPSEVALDAARAATAEKADLEEKLRAAEAQRDDLKAGLEEARAARAVGPVAENELPRGQGGPPPGDCPCGLQADRDALAQVRGELAAARDELAGKARLEERLRAAEAAREEAVQQLRVAREAAAEAQDALRRTEAALAQRKTAGDELQGELRATEARRQKLAAELDQAQAALAERERREEAVRQELRACQDALKQARAATAEKADLEGKLRDAEARRQKLEAELDRLQPRSPRKR